MYDQEHSEPAARQKRLTSIVSSRAKPEATVPSTHTRAIKAITHKTPTATICTANRCHPPPPAPKKRNRLSSAYIHEELCAECHKVSVVDCGRDGHAASAPAVHEAKAGEGRARREAEQENASNKSETKNKTRKPTKKDRIRYIPLHRIYVLHTCIYTNPTR